MVLRLAPAALLAVTFTSYTDDSTAFDYLIAAVVYLILILLPSLQPYALTGSISTGKSTVSKLMGEEGACSVIDLDQIAHQILLSSCEYGVFQEVVKAFGKGILNPKGEIDRTELGAIIFKDPKKRRLLNRITHPRIRTRMMFEMVVRKAWRKERHVVVDIPLLFESKLQAMFSLIVVVSLDDREQVRQPK